MQKYNLKPVEFEAALEQIQEKCNYFFKSKDVLLEALTHSSYAGEHPGRPHNERLEFLGDSVLQLAVTMEVFRKWPQANEGIMTRVRSLLTNEHATAEYTRALGLDAALLLSKGENQEGGRSRESVLGDAFEAFLGAIYVDSGFVVARRVLKMVMPSLDDMMSRLTIEENPKGAIQEFCQSFYHSKPEYVLSKMGGSVQDPLFEVDVMLQGVKLATGRGKSKKLAEKEGAAMALKALMEASPNCPRPSRNIPPNWGKMASKDEIDDVD